MEMQDKEFDQLFKAKLNDFEMEPSPMVWDNIAAELDGKKESKRSIMPYLSIAASVIVIAAASVLFFNRTVKKDEDKPLKLVKETRPFNPVTVKAADSATNTIMEDNGLTKVAAVNSDNSSKPLQNRSVASDKITELAPAITTPAVTEEPEAMIAVVRPEKLQPLQPAISDNNVDVNTTVVNQPKPTMDEPTDVIADPIFDNTKAKKRARGLGGLINTVIAAVDKREDKLIEFTDSDNDEGTKVTAVNLGIFKIRKQ